jgi:hypothetical protein
MKKLLLFLMCLLVPVVTYAQGEALVMFTTSDGSLSLMVPDGWHVEEFLAEFPMLIVSNNPDLGAFYDYPFNLDEGEVLILAIVGDADDFLYSLPDEAGISIAGSFDLQTKTSAESSLQVTTVTGAFQGVTIPDVRHPEWI